jgi:hypothetical protein
MFYPRVVDPAANKRLDMKTTAATIFTGRLRLGALGISP